MAAISAGKMSALQPPTGHSSQYYFRNAIQEEVDVVYRSFLGNLFFDKQRETHMFGSKIYIQRPGTKSSR